jgi:hypothetical protein
LSDRLGRKAEPDHRWSYLDFCLANSSMPRALFISSGGLDERFSSAPGAERDLGQRLLEAGASFRHGARARARRVLIENVAGVLRERRCEGRDDVLLASKHPGLRPSLRLASVLTAQGEGLAFPRLLPVADPALRVGQPALGLVEALKLRTAWRALLERLLSLSYLLGVHEALHPAAERPELTRSLRSGDGVRRVELELDSGGPLGLDPLLAATELDVTWRGRSLARVAALEAGDSWEWERLTRRVVEAGAAPLVRLAERSPEARSELAPPGLRADDDDRGSAAQTGG